MRPMYHRAQHVAGLRSECRTKADLVRAPTYGVCLDVEKPKTDRDLDSDTSR